jgi:hypothetical protein
MPRKKSFEMPAAALAPAGNISDLPARTREQ